MYVGPDIEIPIILNLYWMACSVSTPTVMATNTVPNTDDSMVDCFLEYHVINDIHIYLKPGPKHPNLLVGIMIAVLKM